MAFKTKTPHPIPYQGSKRNLADEILKYFPNRFNRLIEPFAGSAAISIASAFYYKADKFVINDINKPLIDLWDCIINKPEYIIKSYYDIWNAQIGNEEKHYYYIREKFNSSQEPQYLMFLLAKCVKAAVRYNSEGKFNQSPDKRRLGKNPQSMREDILAVSNLLKNKTQLFSTDYKSIFDSALVGDLIYLDPPYQGTGQNGGFNYIANIDFDEFITSLFELNYRGIPYILSFDGRTDAKEYGNPLPEKLNLVKLEINAGRSTQATLLNRKEYTFEAVYLSPALIENINLNEIIRVQNSQLELY